LRVAVYGLNHLGAVTAACLAEAGFNVNGVDPDMKIVSGLTAGKAPLFEPGLDDLVAAGLAGGRLSFTNDIATVAAATLIWVTFDTPVDDRDRADVDWVMDRIDRIFDQLGPSAVVLISSQLPVGSCATIENRFAALTGRRDVTFASSPENLRLGRALDSFRQTPARIVGTRSGTTNPVIAQMFAKFDSSILWMTSESAEMVKHTLNSFLALCVTFTNEIAALCDEVGADARDVEAGIRTDPRVGPQAYVRAGSAFAGGTLARDVSFLKEKAAERRVPLSLIPAILVSNARHKMWALHQLEQRLGGLADRKIALLGLAYKPDTSTVRRSQAIDLARQLTAARGQVSAFDVLVKSLRGVRANIEICDRLEDSLKDAQAAVIGSIDPGRYALTASTIKSCMAQPLVIDQNGLFPNLAVDPEIEYVTFGRIK
jgi:UDPglucose 6-dehydrogenase